MRRAGVRYARTMLRARTRAVSVLLALAYVGDAQADIISDEESRCRSAEAGAACEIDGKPGVCAKSTCSRNDYSDGPPPKTKSVECMVCTPASDAKATDTKATLSTTETKTAADTKTADTKTPSGESKPTTTTKSGCASAATDAGAWQLGCIALGLGLVGFGRRRKT